MNKLIEQIALQAGATAVVTNGIEDVVNGSYIVGPAAMQKFAELIVRKCADVAFDDWCEGTNEESSQMAILKHFGVE